MSSELHVHSQRLKAFATSLEQTISFYSKSIEQLENAMGRLGRSWLDDEFKTFTNSVRKTRLELETYITEARRAKAVIVEQAQAAEAYERRQNT